ncbi:TPA: hypothetical protein NHP07_000267 [Pseudomonas aeruginosa]|nr:DUF5677 domain-containing protein [Pseudomonas aeruginosa]MDP5967184.1 DUF5677 domain-containing protein [Pseudomonas aeruginosa]RWY57995.1 hypothetical protein EQH70_15180 [Pseudomonas aeruginosa]HCE6723031.1 hypothetical protein [Pseudomonas aeruginosa]HCE9614684.1 hypothetical protein [Pseudomonas aeruginosa]HCF5989056.1 hypothetical protein [Pseudomonas aeruginosa]
MSKDTFKKRGFLSSEAEVFRSSIRESLSLDFDSVEQESERATRSLVGVRPQVLSIVTISAILFWYRSVRACQAAILLCERGMAQEGQVLIRTGLESLFYAVALRKDEEVFDRLESNVNKEKLKQIAGMLRNSEGNLTQVQIDDLREFESLMEKPGKNISVFEAAKMADMEFLYETAYRGFSLTAAHGTFSSLDWLLVERDSGLTFAMGPTDQHVSWTLGIAKICLTQGVQAFSDLHSAAE